MRPVKQKNDIKRQPQEVRSPAVVFLYIYFLGMYCLEVTAIVQPGPGIGTGEMETFNGEDSPAVTRGQVVNGYLANVGEMVDLILSKDAE